MPDSKHPEIPVYLRVLIYDVLVQDAGASDDLLARELFYAACDNGFAEYRFSGSLGFGGKLWNERNRWRVTAYPEDMTPERDETIKRTNAALAEIRAKAETR